MSATAIERCQHFAKSFTGTSAQKDTADNLIKKTTTVADFNAKMNQLAAYRFDLWTGGPAKIPPLCQAAASNNVVLIPYICSVGNDSLLSLGDYMGRIPLFVAVHYQALEAIQKLIECGSPINITHTSALLPSGATPLLMAVRMRDMEITKLLRKYGGQCNTPMEKADTIFLTKANNELIRDKKNLTTAIDAATMQFSTPVRDLIADYA